MAQKKTSEMSFKWSQNSYFFRKIKNHPVAGGKVILTLSLSPPAITQAYSWFSACLHLIGADIINVCTGII